MTDQHRDLEATLDALDGLKAIAQKRSNLANAARVRREAAARARQAARREAARKAEVERVQAEMAEEAEAAALRPEGPLCGALYHDSFGREVTCGLDQGHEVDDPTCDAGNGVTWNHYEDWERVDVPDDYCPFHPGGGCAPEDHFPADQSVDQYRLMTHEN